MGADRSSPAMLARYIYVVGASWNKIRYDEWDPLRAKVAASSTYLHDTRVSVLYGVDMIVGLFRERIWSSLYR